MMLFKKLIWLIKIRFPDSTGQRPFLLFNTCLTGDFNPSLVFPGRVLMYFFYCLHIYIDVDVFVFVSFFLSIFVLVF